MSVTLKHSHSVSQNAWYIRFYLWLWDASPQNIDTCHLFWGFIFAPLALILKPIAEVWDHHIGNATSARAVAPSKPSRASRVLTRLSSLGDWLSQSSVVNTIVPALFVIGIVAINIGLAIQNPITFLLVYAAVFGLALVLWGIFHLADKGVFRTPGRKITGGFRSFGSLIRLCYRAVKSNTCVRLVVTDD